MQLSTDPQSNKLRRHHIDESSLRKVIKKAAADANIEKQVTCHTLRHSFATHLLEQGVEIHYIQKLLGHKDIKTTLIYIHVNITEISKIESPLKGMDF